MGQLSDTAKGLTKSLSVVKRISALEAEIHEARQLNLRLAELLDVVAELLIPLADSSDPEVRKAVKKYHASVSSRKNTAKRAK